MFGPGGSFFVWVGGMNGGRDERTDCQRGGCMVVPGAVVSPGHTKRLSLLPCRAPHNSPCTLMRTWLRQMGLTLRLVAAEYLPGCLGLGALFLWDEWRDERTDSRPAGSLSVLFFGGCEGVVV